MTRLFQFLRRAFILSLVGIFISVSTFTAEAAAGDTTEDVVPFIDVCTLAGGTSPEFKNPPFAYAGLEDVDGLTQDQGVTLDAVQGKFTLPGDVNQGQQYDGYLYKSTYWKKNGSDYEPVEDEEGKYTPPTIVVSPGEDNGGPAASTLNYFDLTLKNNLPVNVQLKGNLPQTKENLENQSQYTNIHYHGFNGSPLLGSDDVLVDVPSNVTPNNPTIPPLPGGYYPGDDPSEPKYGGPISDYKMTIKIPYIHQSGLFWYHSHAHSLSDNQVRAGLSGGIVIKGMDEYYNTILDTTDGLKLASDISLDIDKEPEEFSVNQKVMMFKDFNNVLAGGNQDCFTLNGQVQPKITIRPGEVQLWRIANVGADRYMNIALEKETPGQSPEEGELMKKPQFAEPNGEKNFIILARDGDIVEKPVATNSVLLPPAARVELLVVGSKMDAGEKYYLVSDFTTGLTKDDAQWASGNSYLLATVENGGDQVCYQDSGGNVLKLTNVECNVGNNGLYNYITTQEPAQQDKVLPPSKDIVNGDFEECQDEYHHYAYEILPNGYKIVYPPFVPYDGKQGILGWKRCMTQPTDKTYPDPLTKKRYFYFSTSRPDFAKFFLKGFKDEQSADNIQELYDANRIDKISRVGDLEEWHLVNKDSFAHVFHIHQLDFVVTEVTLPKNPGTKYNNYNISGACEDGQTLPDGTSGGFKCKLEPQGYRDVINLPGNSITTIRIPFVNPFITGVFVYHCHILGHEDRGMMNNIKAVNPDSFEISGVTPTFLEIFNDLVETP